MKLVVKMIINIIHKYMGFPFSNYVIFTGYQKLIVNYGVTFHLISFV